MNKKIGYYKEVGEDFAIIAAPDQKALWELVELAKGDLNIEEFAHKMGISPSLLFRLKKGERKRNVSWKHLNLIADHAAPGSGVTLQLLLAANGMIGKDKVTPIRKDMDEKTETVYPLASKPVPDPAVDRYYAATEKKLTPMEKVVDFQEKVREKATKNEVDNFYLNLSVYAEHMRGDLLKELHGKKKEALENGRILQLLDQYRITLEKERAENKDSIYRFLLGDDHLNLSGESARIKKKLDAYFFGRSVSSQY